MESLKLSTASAASPLERIAQLPPGPRQDKLQLSCDLCRRRKLKCDRERPCGTCSRRGLRQSCHYPSNTTTNQRRIMKPTSNIKGRLQELEGLVLQLVESNPHHQPGSGDLVQLDSATAVHTASGVDTATDTGQDSPEQGSMKLSSAGTTYVDASHWMAVLDGIVELRERFDQETDPYANHSPPHPLPVHPIGPQLLYGTHLNATREGILASIPARPVVDRLVSRYFNSFDMYPAVLHSTQFRGEYEEFWTHPGATPTMWLGLLFSIMCLAVQLQAPRPTLAGSDPSTPGIEPDMLTQAQRYTEMTVQCLLLGQYTRGGPYTLETMILYLASEHILSKDADLGNWFLLGGIVQLAMHMGYHKDPRHFPQMSALSGEMRRRVWATVFELDLGISAQMGLPRLIKPYQADTLEPRNLFDSDFDAATVQLPEGRPETVLTPILYRLAKSRITSVLGMILDHISNARHHNYAETANLDMQLDVAHASIPECLQWRSITQCITEPAHIIMQKLFLDILVWKSKIVLHRRYLTREESAYSYHACVRAALRLLSIQHTLDEETQPGGQLQQERWKVTSVVNHDFLLATSALCFCLQQRRCVVNDDTDSATWDQIRDSLRVSHEIWFRSSDCSVEARKIAHAISIVLSGGNATGNSPGDALGEMPSSFPDDDMFANFLSAEAMHESFFEHHFLQPWTGSGHNEPSMG